jgi:hypothetical protein
MDRDRVRGGAALIAGTISCLHMRMLVARHGQPGWVAALTPLSVDGMIVAASTALLTDSRPGRKSGRFTGRCWSQEAWRAGRISAAVTASVGCDRTAQPL